MEPKRYALIENGKISNFIVATEEYANEHGLIEIDELSQPLKIGYFYENGVFSRNLDIDWEPIRVQREKLLLESDLYVLPDRWSLMTSEDQTAWAEYRQALRDLPQSYEDPDDVIWPISPTEPIPPTEVSEFELQNRDPEPQV